MAMTRTDAGRMDAMERKIDQVIELCHQLQHENKTLTEKVEKMAPTVELGQKAISTAGALGWLGKRILWASAGLVGFMFYMQDRWHLVGQLFRRAG